MPCAVFPPLQEGDTGEDRPALSCGRVGGGWEKVQRRYADFLSDWRTDLGGKRNFHNGVGGTYDCIAIMSYYVACKAVTSFREIEEMEENLILPIFRRLRFVNCNKPFWKKLMHRAFVRAKSGCDKWHDYEMSVAPYETDKPIYYEFYLSDSFPGRNRNRSSH